MDTTQLLALSRRGLIAGPHENKEAFFRRVKGACLQEQPNLQKLYSIAPDWVKLIYSNKGLRFWEGACVWEGPTIQLRASFKNKKRLYGIYNKEEMIAHESVHAVRDQFSCPIFEEMLAYQTSKSRFRRTFGPIIRTPQESLLYLLSFLPIFLATPWPTLQMAAFLLNMTLLGYGLVRLKRTHTLFSRAKKQLTRFLGSSKKVLPLMLHLTDEEIARFAACEPDEIATYINDNAFTSIRHAQMCALVEDEIDLLMANEAMKEDTILWEAVKKELDLLI